MRLSELYNLLRINHWFKNLFVLVGVIMALWLDRVDATIQEVLYKSIIAILFASIISSVNYIINQITDLESDKKHPSKKNRPLPSGKINVNLAFLISVIMFLVIFLVSLSYLPFWFSVALVILWIAGILYNVRPIRLKDIPYVDVVAESANHPIRFLIGWFSLGNSSFPPLEVLLLTWTTGAVLMTSKRYDELAHFGKTLYPYRLTFSVYSKLSLLIFIVIYSVLSIILFVMFSFKLFPQLLYLLPLIVVFIVWLINKVVSGEAKARSIEGFVLSSGFIIFMLLIIVGLSLIWTY